MANPIAGAYQAQQTPEVNQTAQAHTTNKPTNQTAAPQDTVTISPQAQAANQAHQAAQQQTAGADADHDGK